MYRNSMFNFESVLDKVFVEEDRRTKPNFLFEMKRIR